MRIDIRTRGLNLDEETRNLIDLRVGHALDRLDHRVHRVVVFLSDENGPRGGVDKLCRVVVSLWRAGVVVVEGQDGRLRNLIDRVANRAGQAVRRTLERTKTIRRNDFASRN